MLFMVWSDTGSCIRAYCVPDSFSSQSSLKLFANGEFRKTIEPNDFNEHVFNSGRHQTGNVGFIIDDNTIDELSGVTDLEIRDAETDILVYRRQPSHPTIVGNFFRLETHLFPQSQLDAAMKTQFRFWYPAIDIFSAETVRQILSFNVFDSMYSSGRIPYRIFEPYLDPTHKRIALLHDPYDELAERLIIIKRLGTDVSAIVGERDALILAPVIDMIGQCGNLDETDLRRAFGDADPGTLSILSDPLTRQLTSAAPDEPAGRNSVPQSLGILSEFDVVGIRAESTRFIEDAAQLIGIDASSIASMGESPRVTEVAKTLRSIRWLEVIIENDLELYHHVKTAIRSSNG